MRFYKIVIKKTTQTLFGGNTSIDIRSGTDQIWRPTGFESLGLDSSFTSYVNGQTVPGAWQVDFDIPVGLYALPMGGASLRVWGVALQDIAQASNLNFYEITIEGGMARGLPLATSAFDAKQQGFLVQGTIFPAYGNWVGTDQTLDMVIVPFPPGGVPQEANLTFNWPAGQKLKDALAVTLKTAYPGFLEPDISVSDKLVSAGDFTDFNGTLESLNRTLLSKSKAIINDPAYAGVFISQVGKKFLVFDGSGTNAAAKQIRYQDLIGQPTWTGFNEIQIKCNLRGDIALGDYIKLPQGGLTTTTPQSNSQFRQSSVFQGEFRVMQMRHVGSSRVPSADAWNTTINAVSSGVSPIG